MKIRQQTLEAVFEDFAYYLETQNYADSTVSAYHSDFRLFHQYALSQGCYAISEMDNAVMRGYPKWLKAKGLRPSSIARRIHSLRSFFKWMTDEGILEENPMARIPVPRRERHIPTYFTEDELQRFLSVPTLNHPLDRAVIFLMVNTGLRRQEVINLNLHDIDLRNNLLTVRDGKGRKDRIVPINRIAKEALIPYLSLRPDVGDPALFIGMRTTPRRIGKAYLHKMFKRCLSQAQITRPGLTLHKIRHTFATRLLEKNVDLKTLQELLGHEELSTTQVYVHSNKARLSSAVERLE